MDGNGDWKYSLHQNTCYWVQVFDNYHPPAIVVVIEQRNPDNHHYYQAIVQEIAQYFHSKTNYTGSIKFQDPNAGTVVRAILGRLTIRNFGFDQDAWNLAGLFASQNDFLSSVETLLRQELE
jgi:hypothetical protein